MGSWTRARISFHDAIKHVLLAHSSNLEFLIKEDQTSRGYLLTMSGKSQSKFQYPLPEIDELEPIWRRIVIEKAIHRLFYVWSLSS